MNDESDSDRLEEIAQLRQEKGELYSSHEKYRRLVVEEYAAYERQLAAADVWFAARKQLAEAQLLSAGDVTQAAKLEECAALGYAAARKEGKQ